MRSNSRRLFAAATIRGYGHGQQSSGHKARQVFPAGQFGTDLTGMYRQPEGHVGFDDQAKTTANKVVY